MALHLRSINVQVWPERLDSKFPFNLPIIKSIKEIEFTAPVTFFVGENGSGKSTLLETIACAIKAVTIGSENAATDRTLKQVQMLARYYRLSWQKRTHRGFFLRAEDFFGYVKKLNQTREELQSDLEDVQDNYRGRSPQAMQLARMPYERELQDLANRYGDGLDNHSHGEAFLALFQSRFIPDGLYLLDEPEAPLSPIRQLAFLSALKAMVAENAQFIIATHSPIILAFPEATILSFDNEKLQQTGYEDLEHVRLTRLFLDNPQAFLRRL